MLIIWIDTTARAVCESGATSPKPVVVKAEDGTRLARLTRAGDATTLIVDEKGAPGFGAFLASSLPDLYATFKRRGED